MERNCRKSHCSDCRILLEWTQRYEFRMNNLAYDLYRSSEPSIMVKGTLQAHRRALMPESCLPPVCEMTGCANKLHRWWWSVWGQRRAICRPGEMNGPHLCWPAWDWPWHTHSDTDRRALALPFATHVRRTTHWTVPTILNTLRVVVRNVNRV